MNYADNELKSFYLALRYKNVLLYIKTNAIFRLNKKPLIELKTTLIRHTVRFKRGHLNWEKYAIL